MFQHHKVITNDPGVHFFPTGDDSCNVILTHITQYSDRDLNNFCIYLPCVFRIHQNMFQYHHIVIDGLNIPFFLTFLNHLMGF